MPLNAGRECSVRVSPLQGGMNPFGLPTQGIALGWRVAAPLGQTCGET